MKYPFLLLFMCLIFSNCEKDGDNFNSVIPGETDPLTFQATAFIQVSETNGSPVENANVNINQDWYVTDENGVVYLKDIELSSDTYVSVQKEGYFHGSRRFIASREETHFVNITLLRTKYIGAISSLTGGRLGIANGMALDFPPDAIADSDGQQYTGVARVFSQFISADDPELHNKMPGNLIGRDLDDEVMVLASSPVVILRTGGYSGFDVVLLKTDCIYKQRYSSITQGKDALMLTSKIITIIVAIIMAATTTIAALVIIIAITITNQTSK